MARAGHTAAGAAPASKVDSGTSTSAPPAPTEATLEMRAKVAQFLRASGAIWSEVPRDQRGLLATLPVVEEVVKAATAFHVNRQGTVDVVWLKKDMPREALKHHQTAYWRRQAGPAPLLEQNELQLVRGIPGPVMDSIRDNGDQELIAHYLYPFLDFWVFILRHLLIWLACIFFYGYLCILQPTLIVGESSKILNIFLRVGPSVVFGQEFQAADLDKLVDGDFTLLWLKSVCASTDLDEWDELEIHTLNWIPALGIPIIVQYGPLSHQFALYIPKYHPYAPYHVISLHQEIIEIDRHIRNIIELAIKIIKAIPSIPQDDTRRACLFEIRAYILAQASEKGLLAKLDKAKAALKRAGTAFIGQQRKSYGQSAGAANQNPCALRAETEAKAVGDPQTPERLAWLVGVINETREKMEAGHVSHLLGCPRDFVHGSEGHALWLYKTPSQSSSIINSAIITNRNNPRTKKAIKASQKAHDKCGEVVSKTDCGRLTLKEALRKMAVPVTSRTKGDRFWHAICDHCSDEWVVKGNPGSFNHTCLEIRKHFAQDLQTALVIADAEEEDQVQDDENDDKTGVTRCSGTLPLTWELGKRLDIKDEVFKKVPAKIKPTWDCKKKPTRKDPIWRRAMDTRGRLLAPCLSLHQITFVYELLAIEAFSSELFEDGKLTPVDGVEFISLSDKAASLSDLTSKERKMIAKKEAHHYIALFTGVTLPAEEETVEQTDAPIAKADERKGKKAKKTEKKEEKVKKPKKAKKSKKKEEGQGEEDEEMDNEPVKPEQTPEEWALVQVSAMLKGKATGKTRKPVFSITSIEEAIQQRLNMGCLRPFHYDFEAKRDLLLNPKTKEELEGEEESEESEEEDGEDDQSDEEFDELA